MLRVRSVGLPDTELLAQYAVPEDAAMPDLIGRLIAGAKEIQAGKAEGKEVEFYGNKALLYKFSYAGLLCDLK